MEERVFHNGLQGKGWDADLSGSDQDLPAERDAAVKAGLLDVNLVLQCV